MQTFANRPLRHWAVILLVGGLAVLGCDALSGLVDPDPEDPGGAAGVSCARGLFKCESPALKNAQAVCVNLTNFTIDYAYACVKPDGTLLNKFEAFLEDLSAYTNRNNITCVSKIKCNRQ